MHIPRLRYVAPPLRISAVALIAALAAGAAWAADIKVKLSGDQEVPPVQTTASGTAQFDVSSAGAVKGTVKTKGVKGIAAHIHEGAAGSNGPVVVPLTMKSDHEWVAPEGAKLTPAQMDALKSGKLYVNVHSDAHKGGEIRGQLKE
jgi:CHRD domain